MWQRWVAFQPHLLIARQIRDLEAEAAEQFPASHNLRHVFRQRRIEPGNAIGACRKISPWRKMFEFTFVQIVSLP
jgi:hypothetical protein